MNQLSVLSNNMLNIHGEKGKKWLSNLPSIIKHLEAKWHLSKVIPVDNMTYNYVAFANIKNTEVALKISCNKQSYLDESAALNHFNGHGAVALLAQDDDNLAMLLKRALPGTTLKSKPSYSDKVVIYNDVVNAMTSTDNQHVKHVSSWCEAVERIASLKFETSWVSEARKLKQTLLNTMHNPYVCHGDLHLDNIVQAENGWLSIDPKGIVAEKAFEAAAFDFVDDAEIECSYIAELLLSRINKLAMTMSLSQSRLLSWFFLRTMISAQWFIEDNGNPDKKIQLAEIIYQLLRNNES